MSVDVLRLRNLLATLPFSSQVFIRHQLTIQIPYDAASAANASGFLQTALSKVTRPSAIAHTQNLSRRVTSDRVLTYPGTFRPSGTSTRRRLLVKLVPHIVPCTTNR